MFFVFTERLFRTLIVLRQGLLKLIFPENKERKPHRLLCRVTLKFALKSQKYKNKSVPYEKNKLSLIAQKVHSYFICLFSTTNIRNYSMAR